MIPFNLTNTEVTVVVDGKPVTLPLASPQGAAVRAALLADDDASVLRHLENKLQPVADWITARGLTDWSLDGQQVSYRGKPLPREINQRLLRMAADNADPMPFVRFHERLQANPSMRSVEQAYRFLAHLGLPIVEDGSFLAYKGVREDLKDEHSGKFDNSPGQVHRMPRNEISDDPNTPCHEGFHVGALEYAKGFAPRVVCVSVAPEDIVCVPYDYSSQKMRVCEYRVVGYHGGVPMSDTNATSDEEVDDAKTVKCLACDGTGDGDEGESCEDCAGEGVLVADEDFSLVIEPSDSDADDTTKEEEIESQPLPPLQLSDVTPAECELLRTEGMISAIRALRCRRLGTGLREAKDVLDLIRSNATSTALVQAPTKVPVKAATTRIVGAIGKKQQRGLAKMKPSQLLECTIDQLRSYAKSLKIVGASKIPGGKAGLVKVITRNRRK